MDVIYGSPLTLRRIISPQQLGLIPHLNFAMMQFVMMSKVGIPQCMQNQNLAFSLALPRVVLLLPPKRHGPFAIFAGNGAAVQMNLC